MASINVQACFGFLLVFTFLSPVASSAQGSGSYYHCDVLIGSTKTAYTSPIIHTDMRRGAIMQDWHKHMVSTYSLTPTPAAPDRYDCVDLCSSPEQQKAALLYEERNWTQSNYKIVHVDYSPAGTSSAPEEMGAGGSTTTASSLTHSSPAPTVRAFMSCSTAGTAGVNIYYTGVFAADLRTGNHSRGARGAVIIDRQLVDPTAVQEVLDRFQAYLTQQGYKFAPGNVYACDVKPTEAAARAAQHYRAYEGGGCTSGCSKIIETGWKGK